MIDLRTTMLAIYFMFDNHTFAKVTGDDRAELVKQVSDLFDKDRWGSVFVRDEHGGELKALTLEGNGVTKDEIEEWAVAVAEEKWFRTLMV